jgi:hypothetical protein
MAEISEFFAELLRTLGGLTQYLSAQSLDILDLLWPSTRPLDLQVESKLVLVGVLDEIEQ